MKATRKNVRDGRWTTRALRAALVAGACLVMTTASGATRADGEVLEIELDAVGAPLTTTSAPFRVTFRNGGETPLNLLAIFEPVPVFFQFQIAGADGTPIDVPGGGKIDPLRGDEPYVALAPGATHAQVVDVAPLLPKQDWASGSYTVSVRYRNAYGVGCYRGVVESEPLTVRIERAP